jgi:GAF domain-containing protein
VLSLLVLYIVAVLPVAIVWGTGLAVVTSILSTAVFAYLFLPPIHSIRVPDSRELAAMGVFLVTAVVVSELAARSRRVALESARLSEEQSALRRVATLVAQAGPPSLVFEAVTREVGLLCGADLARMERYEQNGVVTGVAAWSRVPAELAVGTRFTLDGLSIARGVQQTGGPVRVDSFGQDTGAIAREAREVGIRASVGCPIVVAGRLWGVIAASRKREDPFPHDTEAKIAGFTELVATAIANAQAREELRAIAGEQAALRRVATLVARGEPPEAVFAAVAQEVGRLLLVDFTFVSRYDPDGTVTNVGGWNRTGDPVEVGTRYSTGGQNVTTLVLETGRPARIDSYAKAFGAPAAAARKWGAHSAAGALISVEGRLWGLMTVASGGEEPLPLGTEARLADFAELVATAIANAQAQAELTACAPASSPPPTRPGAALSATCTTAPSSGWFRWPCSCAPPRRRFHRSRTRSTRSWPASGPSWTRCWASCASCRAAFIRRSCPRAASALRCGPWPAAARSRSSCRWGWRGRLPERVEVAAYYVVAEALTNVAKHAGASVVQLEVDTEDGLLRLGVRDDGVGGADPTRGSGLVGLKDRVEATGGTLRVDSRAGQGTSLLVELPIDAGQPPDST